MKPPFVVDLCSGKMSAIHPEVQVEVMVCVTVHDSYLDSYSGSDPESDFNLKDHDPLIASESRV